MDLVADLLFNMIPAADSNERTETYNLSSGIDTYLLFASFHRTV